MAEIPPSQPLDSTKPVNPQQVDKKGSKQRLSKAQQILGMNEPQSSSQVPPIQKKHTVQKLPGNFLSRLVARGVLNALNPRPTERSKVLKETPLPEDWSELSACYEGGKLNQENRPPLFPYHKLQFNKESTEYTVLQVPEGTPVDKKLIALLEKYKTEKKNILLVETVSVKPDAKTSGTPATARIKEYLEDTSKFPKDTYSFSFEELCPIVTTSTTHHIREVNIASTKGALLNGVEIALHPGLEKLKIAPKDQKWIVYYLPNAAKYEDVTPFLQNMAKKVGANVICVNYRGVGDSSGFPTGDQDLIDDGDAVVEYLKKQNVAPENILLYGRSLGGAVATHVAEKRVSNNEKVSLCTDRSFSSLYKVVASLISIFKAILPILATFAPFIPRAFGWKLDSASKLKSLAEKKTNIIVMHHPDDQIILREAAARNALKNFSKDKNITEITLKEKTHQIRDFGYAHNRDLSESEEQEFIKAARTALRITSSQSGS